RFSRDWSSDVCSSDLVFPAPRMLHLSRNLESLRLHRPAVAALLEPFVAQKQYRLYRTPAGAVSIANLQDASNPKEAYTMTPGGRSEELRGGKGGTAGW